MSYEVTTAFVQQYATNVALLLQQRGSRLRDCCTMGSYTGKAAKAVEQIGAVAAQQRTSRHADTPLISTPHDARWVYPTDYEWADLIDDQDKLRMLIDPTSPYAMNGAYALGRALDDTIITAALGTSNTGENGSTSTAFDTTNQQIASGAAGLTVAKLREAVPWTSLFSPFPFHSVYSIEDHKKHLDWVREINPDVVISVKVSTPSDVDMVAVGSFYAGASIIHLDGGYGGTGAAPEIAKKNIAMPIEYAIPKTHNFLEKEGVRDEMVLIVSGGIRTPDDVLKSIALGADGVVIGTSELVALECVRCGNCERDRGCPIGIATSDPQLQELLEPGWGARRIYNMYQAWLKRMKFVISRLGFQNINELRGKTECLTHKDYL